MCGHCSMKNISHPISTAWQRDLGSIASCLFLPDQHLCWVLFAIFDRWHLKYRIGGSGILSAVASVEGHGPRWFFLDLWQVDAVPLVKAVVSLIGGI